MADQGELVVKLALDNSNFTRGMQNLNRQIKKAAAEFKNAAGGTKGFEKGLDGLQAKAKMLTSQIDAQTKIVNTHKSKIEESREALDRNTKKQVELSEKIKSTSKSYEEVIKLTGENSEEAKELKAEIESLSKEYENNEERIRNNVRTLENYEIKTLDAETKLKDMQATLKDTNKDIEVQSSKFTKISDDLNKFGNQAKQMGEDIKKLGSNLSKYITLPLAGIGIASASANKGLNESMANIATLIPQQGERLQELKGDIQDISVIVSKETGEIADGIYNVISAYGDAEDTSEKAKLNAIGAKAGLAETSDALNLTSAVMKGFGDTTAIANEKVLDLAFATVKLGQTSFKDLGASIGKVVPTTVELGISQEEMFNVFATGTGVTGNASEVATQYQGVLKALMAPTKSMSKLMSELGVENGKAMIEQYGLVDSLKLIKEQADKTGEPLQKYIGSIQGQVLALALAGKQYDTYNNKLIQMKNSTGAMTEAFEEQTDGINKQGFTWDRAMEKMRIAAERLGEALAPTVGKIAELFDKLATSLLNLKPETLDFIAKMGQIAVVIGPILLAVVKLTSGIGGLALKLSLLSSTLGGLSLSFGAVAGMAASALGPILAVVAGVTAVGVVGKKLLDHFKSSSIEVESFGESVSGATKKSVESFMELDKQVGQSLFSLKAKGGKVTKEAADEVVANFKGMTEKIIANLEEDKAKALEEMSKLFKETGKYTEEEIKERQALVQKSYDEEIQDITEHQEAIEKIYRQAQKEDRELKEEEIRETERHREAIKNTGIKTLSETEAETKVILQKLKDNQGAINAEMLADTVKSTVKQKEEAIANAEEEYEERVKYAEQIRAQGGKENEKLADEIIENSKLAKKGAVEEAEEMYEKVVEAAKKQAGEHADYVDWETGEVLSKWEQFKVNTAKNFKGMRKDTKEELEKVSQGYEIWRKEVVESWKQLGRDTKKELDKMAEGVKSWGSSVKKNFVNMLKGLRKTAGENAQAMVEDFYNFGKNIIEGLGKGIESMTGWVTGKIKGIANSISSGFKTVLGIHSPSREFEGFGLNIVEGLGLGIAKNGDIAIREATELANRIIAEAGFDEAIKRLSISDNDEEANIKNRLAIIEVQKAKIKDLEAEYKRLMDTKAKDKKEAEKLSRTREKALEDLRSAETQLIKYTKEHEAYVDSVIENEKRLAEERRNNAIAEVDKLHNALMSGLKKKYEEEYSLREKSINEDLAQLENWKDESIKRINDVYDARIKRIDEATKAQVGALEDELKAMDNYEKEKSREEIKKEMTLNISSLEDALAFEHNEYNKAELEKQIEAEKNKWKEQQEEWLKEDKKEKLREQIDLIKANAEEEKAILEEKKNKEILDTNELYAFERETLESRMADNRDFLQQMTEDRNLQMEVEKMFVKNQQDDIIDILEQYEPEYYNAGLSYGEQLLDGMLPAFQAIIDMIDQVRLEFGMDKVPDDYRPKKYKALYYKPEYVETQGKHINQREVEDLFKEEYQLPDKNVSYEVNITSPKALSPREQRKAMNRELRKLSLA